MLATSSTSSRNHETSSEILRFASIVHDNLRKTSSNFYHSLHIWYHDILTSFMIFGLRLLFIEFKNNSTASSWSCFVNKMFEIDGLFLDTASHYTKEHEYHFSIHFFSLFEWLAVIIWIIQENSIKWNKLKKYRKSPTNVSHWNMEYQVLYEDCRKKSLEVKSEKNMVWRVSKNDTRQITALPSVRRRHSAKG